MKYMYCISVDKMAAHNVNNVGVFFMPFHHIFLKQMLEDARTHNTLLDPESKLMTPFC